MSTSGTNGLERKHERQVCGGMDIYGGKTMCNLYWEKNDDDGAARKEEKAIREVCGCGERGRG